MSNIEIPAEHYTAVAALVEAGKTVEEAIAEVERRGKPETPRPDAGNVRTKAKAQLERYLELGGWGRVWTEHRFHPVRRWRADYYLPDQSPPVLIEYDGLMNNPRHGSNVGHASINGIVRDSEKMNAATAMGIRCFRANAKSIWDKSFFTLLDTVLTPVIPEREDDQP